MSLVFINPQSLMIIVKLQYCIAYNYNNGWQHFAWRYRMLGAN